MIKITIPTIIIFESEKEIDCFMSLLNFNFETGKYCWCMSKNKLIQSIKCGLKHYSKYCLRITGEDDFGFSELENYKIDDEFKQYRFCNASSFLKQKFVEVSEYEEKEK